MSLKLTALTLELESEIAHNTPVSTHSNIIISGHTSFIDLSSSMSAVTSYQGNITLSGTISFVNNSAIKGGAITLLSSTVNIDANIQLLHS